MTDKITLDNLQPAEGSTHKIKRVGRGRSSGRGKTSCRGHNGEGQRSGSSSKEVLKAAKCHLTEDCLKLKGFQVYKKPVSAEINVGRLAQLGMKEVCLAWLNLKPVKLTLLHSF